MLFSRRGGGGGGRGLGVFCLFAFGPRPSRLFFIPPFHRQNLFDDFARFEIALPAVEAARAEFTTISTADLRGDAERVPVAGLAVKRRTGRNQDAFDELAVGEFPEKFLRCVVRTLFADEFKRVE